MVLTYSNNNFVKYIIPLTLLLFVTVNFIWPDNGIRKTTIAGDGRGHYVYLPLIFIEKTVDFKSIYEKEKEERPGFIGHNFHKINGVYVNKFPIGTAVLISPFFVIAHIIAKHTNYPANGFSLPYQYAVAIAALFWLLTGLLFLKKLLSLYRIKQKIICAALIFTLTATNLFHYAFLEVSLSHLYSFTFITIFLYFTKKLFNKFSPRLLFIASLLLGVIVLIRQVNILIILTTPFMANDKGNFVTTLKLFFTKPSNLILATTGFLIGFSPQLIINYIQTGRPLYYAYTNEGFNFLKPQIFKFLFSFQKGWFIYTPAMLLIFPSLVTLYKSSKYHFYTFSIFLFIIIYIFSSWWNWFFGDSFGMRPMVDYYSVLIIVIALWGTNLKFKMKALVLSLLIIFSLLNIFQSYQYSKGIIHVDSMDFKAYKYVFLKYSDKYRNKIGPDPEYYYGKLSAPEIYTEFNVQKQNQGWNKPKNEFIEKDKNGYFVILNKNNIYSPSFLFLPDSNLLNKKLYLKLSATYSETDKNAGKSTFFIADVRNKINKTIFYKAFPLKKIPDNKTNEVINAKTGIKLPILKNNYTVKIYIWDKEGKELKLYNIKSSIHEIIVE